MTNNLHVLVVEDDDSLRDAIALTLECAGHRVTAAGDGPQALRLVEDYEFNLVLSDVRMQPMDGLALLAELRAREPQLPVLLMTAFADVDRAVAAMRGGACDFLLKPFEPEVLLAHVARYAVLPPPCEGLVAADNRTRNLLGLALRVARTDATVLLTGESGTGKEVFARYIHAQSARAGKPFVAINCAAIPDNLLEATLFGHEKGAFTGAQTAQPGKFEQADGGTLLLDEISEMPLALQAKLLRVLQEREVERVGGKKPVRLDIRVLATSNRDMLAEVAAGRFREDLYYRLNVFPLRIPSLRERPGDIVPLARYYLAEIAARERRNLSISDTAAAILAAYAWPGNVRELVNALQRAAILCATGVVEACDLQLESAASAYAPPAAPGGPLAAAPPPQQPVAAAAAPAYAAGAGENRENADKSGNMRDLERTHILQTLAAVGGSRRLAVEKLGISERTLRYKLAQWREQGLLPDGMV
ncbi:MAG: sigma-54-dependent Fis family transcriptional regulator [Rhodocyclaceae bacterium]|nr:sigma-54-dependent Fis family transcriptional regulator [Rhodocyclaceae bacterium]